MLQELASKLRRTPEVWTATAGQVAEWWRGRAAVHLATAPDGHSVTLVNTGPHEFVGGRLIIDAPDGRRQFVVLPVLPSGASARVDDRGQVTLAAPPVGDVPLPHPVAAVEPAGSAQRAAAR